MMKLRLKRFGKKFENPRTKETQLDVPAIVLRIKQGAQPTDTVRRILEKAKVFDLVTA